MSRYVQSGAMLVSLTMRAWKAQAVDRHIAQETEKQYETDTGVISVIKSLVPRHYTSPIHSIMTLGRSEHYRLTVPGLVRGQHMLPMKVYDEYISIQNEVMSSFERRVNDFLEVYPDIIKSAPKRLGSAYGKKDFPQPSEIRGYFEYSIKRLPIPDLKDWRLDGMSDGENNEVRNEAEDAVRIMYNNATKELFERAKEVLLKVAKQTKEYSGGGPGAAQLRDATINNLKEVAHLVVKMNVTNDEDLSKLGYQMIEIFDDVEGKTLRENEDLRKKVAILAEKLAGGIPA